MEGLKGGTPLGVLIFDMNNRVRYFNKDALLYIPDLEEIHEEVFSICNQSKSEGYADVLLQRAGLTCYARALLIHGEDKKQAHIVVLIEPLGEHKK